MTRVKDGTPGLLNIHNQSEQGSLKVSTKTPMVDLLSKPSLALIIIVRLSMTSHRHLVLRYLSPTSSQAYRLHPSCLMITNVANPSLHRQMHLCHIISITIPILRRHILEAAAMTRANSMTTEFSHNGLLQRHLPFRNSAPVAPTLQWSMLLSR